MYDIEVYQRAFHALVSTINTISINFFSFFLLPSPRYIETALVSMDFASLHWITPYALQLHASPMI